MKCNKFSLEQVFSIAFNAVQRRCISGIGPGVNVRTLSYPISGRSPKVVSAEDAVKLIKSGDHIYVMSAPSTPTDLLKALCNRVEAENLSKLKMSHIILSGEIPWLEEKFYDKVRSNCLFISANLREIVNKGKADYTPVLLSQTIRLYDEKIIPVDVALLTVSPPDQQGYCSLGVSVEMSSAAARNSNIIIAAVNPTMPRTFGDSAIHVSQIDAIVNVETPIFAIPENGPPPSPEEEKIGKLIAENLVEDGATLQMGIGSIPDSVLRQLKNHKDLGVHSEMISDGVMDLLEKNVITNNKKTVLPGKVVTSFSVASRKFYDLVDNNPLFVFASSAFTNSFEAIISNSKMTAINAAIEIDLSGQICADTIGDYFYSGFGGQLDFIHASNCTLDGKGKPIIALPSRTTKGESRIVPYLKQGAGVVTTRAQARYIVTENGIADIWGKTIRQRAYELIRIAHPNDREKLEKAAFQRFKCMPSKD
uniref:Acetyl-CoA hydrolase n=1 Tax=Acrobeloides nanus TaxID=290746 RepID=A0A914E0P5_9BILA